MSAPHAIARATKWVASLFRRQRAERELKDELQFHLEMERDSLVRQGMSLSDAEIEARRRFGGVDRFTEFTRDERGTRVVESAWYDLRYALRIARRAPSFTALVVLTLGVAIGANTAMFTVIDAALLTPLPFVRSNEIVSIFAQNPDRTQPRFSVSYADFLDWQRDTKSFAGMSVIRNSTVTLLENNEPARLSGLAVSGNFFQLLGIKPARGRLFVAADGDGDANNVVVLSHALWSGRLASDSAIVGRNLVLSGRARTVIGVLPENFTFDGRPIDVITVFSPSMIPGAENHAQHMLEVVGRLKTGVTLEQANQDLAAVAKRVQADHPEIKDWSSNVFNFQDELVRGTRGPLLTLLAAAGLVLLIGCINVAGLLLARGISRGREIALRRAMGASRTRVIMQLLFECGVLAIGGSAVGIVVSVAATRALLRMGPAGVVPNLPETGINVRVLAFALALSVFTTVIVGLIPAFRATGTSLSLSLREGGRGASGGAHAARFRRALVVAEISLALVLLLCAGLVMQSLQHTLNVNPGFDARHVATMRLTLSPAAYPESLQAPFYRDMLTQLQSQPGITAAAAANTAPIAGGGIVTNVFPKGRVLKPAEQVMTAATAVTPGYFTTMRMQLIRGRDVQWSDARPTIVLSEASAKQLWPGEEAIGKHLGFSPRDTTGLEVVGIVNDTHARGLTVEPTPMVYLSFAGAASIARTMSLVVRGTGDDNTLIATTRRVLKERDATLPLYNVQTVQTVIDNSIAQPRLNTALLAVFASIALLLSAIGIYGVVSYSVAQRSREIGVRMALGAGRSQVFQLVLREGMWLAVLGVTLGIVGAFAATPLVQSWLFGIEHNDPFTFASTASLLAAVAVLASVVPAIRATRVDPLTVMRGE